MNRKIEYTIVNIIAFLLVIILIGINIYHKPVDASLTVVYRQPPSVLNPYPELEGLHIPINSATIEDLEKLPNIGPTKAKRIFEYVRDYGPIVSLDELLEVDGIGEKTLQNIGLFLTLE